MTTFYLAASSVDRGAVQDKALDLISLGLEWHHDWTTAENWDVPDEAMAALAVLDIDAARSASVFVALLEPHSRGTDMEIGARLSAGKQAHVVGPAEHFFFNHPNVVKWADWNQFVSHLTSV